MVAGYGSVPTLLTGIRWAYSIARAGMSLLRFTVCSMLIDCNSCQAPPTACSDCVMTVLLGPINGELELDDTDTKALDALAVGGLVPPLRMVPILDFDAAEPSEPDRHHAAG